MKRFAFAAIALSLVMLAACGLESKGDAAWRDAQKAAEGSNQRLMKQKEAYERYREAYNRAVKKGNVSTGLLNKYLLSAIARVEFIFDATGSPNAPAVELLRKDIESRINTEGVLSENKDRYARFLITVAQHHRNNEDISRFMQELKNARTFAANKMIADAVEKEATGEFAIFQVLTAHDYLKTAEAAKRTRDGADPLDYIRAEYYARAALIYDPKNAEAQRILATTRRELISTFTAYESAVLEYSDTALFRQINSDGILMAVPTVRTAGGRTQLDISVYNNSFNAVKPRANMFKLVLTDGREITAERIEFERSVLQQKHDVKGKLFFRGNFNRDNIKKLSFHHKLSEDIPAIVGNKYFQ